MLASNLSLLIPAPIRDMIRHYQFLDSLDSPTAEEVESAPKIVLFLENSVIRIAIASLAIFAVYGLGYSAKVVALATVVTSLPAALIAAGSCLMYFNSIALISAVSTLSLKAVGLALAGVALGYLLNFNHRVEEIAIPKSVRPTGSPVVIREKLPPLPSYGVIEDLFIRKPFRDAHAENIARSYYDRQLS